MRRYARDFNPGGKPPPWDQRIKALLGAAMFIINLLVGASTPDSTVRAVAAVLCVVGLMVALYYPMKSLDDARERGEHLD